MLPTQANARIPAFINPVTRDEGASQGTAEKNNRASIAQKEVCQTITACAAKKNWRRAVCLLDRAKLSEVVVDAAIYNAAMDVCSKARQWGEAVSILRRMPREGIEPDLISFNCAMNSCAQAGEWEAGLAIFEEVRASPRLQPDTTTFNVAMNLLKRGDRGDASMNLLDDMVEHGVHPDVFTLSSCISALASQGSWQAALGLLSRMETDFSVKPDVYSFSAAIRGCEVAKQWAAAVDILRQMQARGVPPNNYSFCSAMNACSRGGQGGTALALFRELLATQAGLGESCLGVDAMCFNAAVEACAHTTPPRWEDAFRIIDKMVTYQQSDSKTFSRLGPNRHTFLALGRVLWNLFRDRQEGKNDSLLDLGPEESGRFIKRLRQHIASADWRSVGHFDYSLREADRVRAADGAPENARYQQFCAEVIRPPLLTHARQHLKNKELHVQRHQRAVVDMVLRSLARPLDQLPRGSKVLLVDDSGRKIGSGLLANLDPAAVDGTDDSVGLSELVELGEQRRLEVTHWSRFASMNQPGGAASRGDGELCDDLCGGDGLLYDVCVMGLPVGQDSFAFMLQVVSRVLKPGASLFIYGPSQCKYLTDPKIVYDPLFSNVRMRAKCSVPEAPMSTPTPVAETSTACLAANFLNPPESVLGGFAPLDEIVEKAAAARHRRSKTSSFCSYKLMQAERSASCHTSALVERPPASDGEDKGSYLEQWRSTAQIKLTESKDEPARAWFIYPGLFSGGRVDVMTKVLLQVLPTPLCGPRGGSGGRGDPSTRAPSVLDWGCGSGVIAGYLRLAEPFLDLHLLDADALALRAASRNVPGAQCYWSDCWRGVDDLVDDRRFAAENVGGAVEKASPPACAAEGPAAERGKLQRMPLLDAIVSNPPVHAGLLDSLSVLEALVEGAARRLRPSTGVLWVVAQEHVPVGCVLELHGGYRDVRMQSQGRFTVWSASLLLR